MTTPQPRQHGPQQESRSTVRDFEQGLASVLQRLRSDPTRWIVIAELERNPPLRYVQFLADEDGTLAVECVSNRYLKAGEQWRPDQERLLLELGWSLPRDDRPNWHFVGRTNEAVEQVRELVHLTLAELFGAGDEDRIEFKMAWSAPAGGD